MPEGVVCVGLGLGLGLGLVIVVITVNHFKLEPNDGKLASCMFSLDTVKGRSSQRDIVLHRK